MHIRLWSALLQPRSTGFYPHCNVSHECLYLCVCWFVLCYWYSIYLYRVSVSSTCSRVYENERNRRRLLLHNEGSLVYFNVVYFSSRLSLTLYFIEKPLKSQWNIWYYGNYFNTTRDMKMNQSFVVVSLPHEISLLLIFYTYLILFSLHSQRIVTVSLQYFFQYINAYFFYNSN